MSYTYKTGNPKTVNNGPQASRKTAQVKMVGKREMYDLIILNFFRSPQPYRESDKSFRPSAQKNTQAL